MGFLSRWFGGDERADRKAMQRRAQARRRAAAEAPPAPGQAKTTFGKADARRRQARPKS